MIKMSVFNKINDKSIVDTFKNVLQRGSSEVFQPDIPEFRKVSKSVTISLEISSETECLWQLIASKGIIKIYLQLYFI